jgi:hypothetical protein
MEQKKFEKILHSLYPNLTITNYKLWERYEVDDDGKFIIPNKPAIFVEVKGEYENVGVSIGEDISRMTGLEVIIDKFE